MTEVDSPSSYEPDSVGTSRLLALFGQAATSATSDDGMLSNPNFAYSQEDISEIRDDQMEAFPAHLLNETEDEDVLPKALYGPPSLIAGLRALTRKYKHIFSRNIRAEPARIKPFKFDVDSQLWEQPKNRSKRRQLDRTRSVALNKLIIKLKTAGAITPSRAGYYSHGFTVAKSTPGDWRLVVDFKILTKCLVKNLGQPRI